jgi:voltage-gated potassium channel
MAGEHRRAGRTPLRERSPEERGETPAGLRWRRLTYWPLTAAALIFLVVYTMQVIGDLDGALRAVTGSILLVIFAMFAVNYAVQLALSRPRGRWAATHLFDLVVVFVPVLRPVRLLDALTRITAFTRTAASSLRARLLVYGIGATLLLVWQAALYVLEAERHADGATITTFADALWWAFCTVTTVGYGDYTPVTAWGRVVAVLLMLTGVVLVGLITATFASAVVERVTRTHHEQAPATRADVDEVLAALRRPGSVRE